MTVEKQTFIQPASSDPNDRIPHDTEITNVVATLKGTQPASANRVYVVSGHYDSRCTGAIDATCDAPGADDDGSGVAAMMEMARVMAAHQFAATIKFMAVAGEEEGLYGSAFFAKNAKAQGMDIEGMLNNDIIGSDTGDLGQKMPFTIRLFSEGVPTAETPDQAANLQNVGGESDSPARELARYVQEVAQNSATHMQIEQVFRRDRYLRGGDQISFLEQGYPAVRFTEPIENFDHEHQDVRVENGVQFGDLAKFMDFAFNDRVARVNALTLANLADAPATPKDVRIITANLTNDTTLAWSANTEPDLKGYEIVWRNTTDPDWTHVVPVGNVTTFTAEPLKGQRVLRRPSDQRRGIPQPGRVPGARSQLSPSPIQRPGRGFPAARAGVPNLTGRVHPNFRPGCPSSCGGAQVGLAHPELGRAARLAGSCIGSCRRARRRGGSRSAWSAGRLGLGRWRSGRPAPRARRCRASCCSRPRARCRSGRRAGGRRTPTSSRCPSSRGRTIGRRSWPGGSGRRTGMQGAERCVECGLGARARVGEPRRGVGVGAREVLDSGSGSRAGRGARRGT